MRQRKRPPAIALCGSCGARLTAASIDALNAKLQKHYKTCSPKA